MVILTLFIIFTGRAETSGCGFFGEIATFVGSVRLDTALASRSLLAQSTNPWVALCARFMTKVSSMVSSSTESNRSPATVYHPESVKAYMPDSYVHQLPKLLRLNGKPYCLNKHFPMEAVFKTPLPEDLTIVSGRQVTKTTVISARQVLIGSHIPNVDIMTITPLFEQVRNISSNIVARFINESPLRNRWLGPRPLQNVLQRSFANGSNLFYSYAGDSADRVRGKSIDMMNYDEAQDIDWGLIAVINETMSASVDWEIRAYTGTPKTLTTALEHAWNESSQARWVIPCLNGSCRFENICTKENINKMIGTHWSTVSLKNPGTICAKCQRVIFPHLGWWSHAIPSRSLRKPGLHIPQIIMPMHYSMPRKWRALLDKVKGKQGYTQGKLYNEVFGIPFDRSNTVISQTELAAASQLPWAGSDKEKAFRAAEECELLIMSVDWSGGGSLTGEGAMSTTAIAVMGVHKVTRKMHVIYGERLDISNDSFTEAAYILQLYREFQCDMFAHDYTGAGGQRENIMVHSGLPIEKIWPVRFVMATKGPACRVVHGNVAQHPRVVWQVDKPRCIQMTCAAITQRMMLFFKNDNRGPDDPGLIADFLALVEHKIQTMRAGETYTIRRDPNKMDDFAMAVSMGAFCIWHITQSWPDFGIDLGDDTTPLAQDAQDYLDLVKELKREEEAE